MDQTLLDAVRWHAEAHTDRHGVAETPIPSLRVLRATRPSPLQYAISRPMVALVLQGSKRVTMGPATFDFGAGDSLLVTADVPTVSQVTRASSSAPYYSLVLDLDLATIERLVVDMGTLPSAPLTPVRVDPTDADVADAALRLMRLIERPTALPVLQASLLRELHFWLMSGRHGEAIGRLGVAEYHARRVARAVALIRERFAERISIERLARVAGMSPSSFHEHFRAITSLTPLQFQKQLRLIEARRLLLADGDISTAAYAVGYESVPQFTREYGRLFGQPPARDMRAAKLRRHVA